MTIAAIILAAGQSRRFGADNKLLADIDGEPMIARITRRLAASNFSPLLIVTGEDHHRIAAAVSHLPVEFATNPEPRRGMGSSIATGVAALPDTVEGALIVPADMPDLSPALLATLIARFRQAGATAPVYPILADGQPTTPALWPRSCFQALSRLDGAAGAKPLLRQFAGSGIAGIDPDQLVDIDTPADLAAWNARRTP